MKSTIIKGILIAALSGFSGLASALVYDVNLAVGSGSANGTITTDGVFGVLGYGDIVDWNIVLNPNPGSTFTLLGPSSGNNSSFYLDGTGFTASATSLNFDFSGSGCAGFQNPYIGSGMNYLSFAASVCGGYTNAINLATDIWAANTSPQDGIQVVATISPVPEPQTYAMLLVGLGLIGFMARRRKEGFNFAV
jgi:hypothetical protein